MIPKNPGTIKKIPQNPGAPPKSTQNNGTSPYHDICKLPLPPPKEIVKRHSEIKLSCKLRCVKPRLRLPCLKSRRVPPSVVRPCLHGTVYHCQTQNNNFVIRSKMARQLFNVANIKYRCLSYGGHSVRFLNRSGKFIQSSNRISEMFFFT